MDDQRIFEALADPTRRRILDLLRRGDMSAGEIAQQFEVSWPSVSRHLGVLKTAGMVRSQRIGQNVAYTLEPIVLALLAAEVGRLTGREPGGGDDAYTMFERFNEQARRAISDAQEEARDLGHDAVEPAHLVLGLLDVDEGVAARVLDAFGVQAQTFREQIRSLVPREQDADRPPPLSTRSRRVLDGALAQAASLGHKVAGTGPILLEILSDANATESPATLLASAFALDVAAARTALLDRMRHYSEGPPRPVSGGLFERLTDRARRAVVLSNEAARELRHTAIGTEHVLLGLVRESDGLAARTLASLGVTPGEALDAIRGAFPYGVVEAEGHLPFTPETKRVLELSAQEAVALAHNYVSTEHLLLAILRDEDGAAVRVLRDAFRLEPAQVRQSLLSNMTGASVPDAVAGSLGTAIAEAIAPLTERIDALFSQRTPPRITPREREVLGHVAEGRTTREIAELLFVAEDTVRRHLRSVVEKLNRDQSS